jgi:hypothetical protein
MMIAIILKKAFKCRNKINLTRINKIHQVFMINLTVHIQVEDKLRTKRVR